MYVRLCVRERGEENGQGRRIHVVVSPRTLIAEGTICPGLGDYIRASSELQIFHQLPPPGEGEAVITYPYPIYNSFSAYFESIIHRGHAMSVRTPHRTMF